jgi:O-antigen/teichoic acid export membrane protein
MSKIVREMKKRMGKTNENDRVILGNIVGAFIIKGGALIISLLTIPAYLRYFDNQQILGLWFTVLSVLSWILTFDFGIGNGLRNHLVLTLVKKDFEEAKRYISSAYFSIGMISILAILLALIMFRFVNWNDFFNISVNLVTKETLNLTVLIVFAGIMLQFFLKIITSILYAMQKSAINNLLSLISSVITLLYVSFAKASDISANLILLAVINVMAVNLPLLLATIIVFHKKLKACRPGIKYCKKENALDVMKLGGIFFWVQIMYMIITNTNEFLISWFSKPEMVVNYQIYSKLFNLAGTVFALALTPIWSTVTKALAEKNYMWIMKLYKKLQLLAFLAVLCEFAIIPFLQPIINIWLGDKAINVNYIFAVLFAVNGSILIWNGVICSITNGLGELKIQSIFFTIGAFVNIPIAWLLVNSFDSWIGVVVSNIISMRFFRRKLSEGYGDFQ